eukprot:Phypoly_transcript_12503.p1 GENE.Phypoly_transcript_12503~~Phypoly_transcript_12503.p1  ORF type:complete len:328 (+),score=11.67 Phypoly_transcript_12503:70-984(+)
MDLLTLELNVTAPFCLFSTIICGVAIITSYVFPQQRKFPNVVLVWACISDFIMAMFVATQLLPGPISSYFAFQIPRNPFFCVLSMYILWALQQSTSMLNLLLAFTLYASIVKKIDLEENKLYYYGYIATLWIPTLLIPVVCIFKTEHRLGAGYCDTASRITVGIRAGWWLLCLCVQVFLLTKVFRVIYKITYAVQSNCSNASNMSNAFVWLSVRCIGAQFNNFAAWTPFMLVACINLLNGEPWPILMKVSALTPCFLFVNGFIVIAGNKPLKTFVASLLARKQAGKPERIRVPSFSQPTTLSTV